MTRLLAPKLRAALCAALIVFGGARPATAPAPAQADRPAQPSGRQRLFLAVMRADGVMIPFASFGGRNWSTPWPRNIGGGRMGGPVEIPFNLDAIPDDWWDKHRPGRWRLFTGAEQPMKTVTPLAPVTIFVGIMRRLGLRTDHPPGRLPANPRELPFPKEGLVIGGEGEVDIRPIVTVSRAAAEWRNLPGLVREDVNRAEERTVSAISTNTGWRHPFARSVRTALAASVEAWYVTSVDDKGSSVSYVEMVKKYAALPEDEGCGLETFVSGWIHTRTGEPAQKPKTSLAAVVSYCDRVKVSYMLPFAQIRLNDRTHWVFQMSGQDHEWYQVVEATTGRVRSVAEYDGGGLPAGMLNP